MGRIQTGVDKLVALVKDKQKIDMGEAAKSLGVSKTIVQEWADFLEEEGIVEIKYSFAKTYLVDKKLTKTETAQRERKLEQQRETFIDKVDQTIQNVEHESKGFEEFRKDFQVLKKDLTTDMETLHAELGALHALEHSKRTAANSLTGERHVLKRREEAATRAIAKEYARYTSVQKSLEKQERLLSDHKRRIDALIRGERRANSKLDRYAADAARLREQVAHENGVLLEGARKLHALENEARKARKDLAAIERTKLKPLKAEKDRITKKMRILEERILAKARAERAHAKRPRGTTTKVRRGIEELFKRKKSIEHLLETVERDKHALIDDLADLESRAEAYRVGKNAVKLEELRKKLAHIDNGKKVLQSHLAQFIKLLR